MVIGATLPGGLLAGFALNKAVVQLPAWRRIGAGEWPAHVPGAELTRGLVFYPARGLAAPAFRVAAAVSGAWGRDLPKGSHFPIVGAAVPAIASLVITRVAMAGPMSRMKQVQDLSELRGSPTTWRGGGRSKPVSTFSRCGERVVVGSVSSGSRVR